MPNGLGCDPPSAFRLSDNGGAAEWEAFPAAASPSAVRKHARRALFPPRAAFFLKSTIERRANRTPILERLSSSILI
jgi:hypothetical protein